MVVNESTPVVYTVEEAATLLKLGRSATYDAVRRGDIPPSGSGEGCWCHVWRWKRCWKTLASPNRWRGDKSEGPLGFQRAYVLTIPPTGDGFALFHYPPTRSDFPVSPRC